MKLLRRFISLFIAFFLIINSTQIAAQIYDPVKWEFSVKDIGNGEFDLLLEATIDEHWHLYNQTEVEDGPVPTSFIFDENSKVEFIGKVQEGESITAYEAVLDMELSFFADHAEFTQRVKKLDAGEVEIKGELTFMTCDDKQCLPPEYIDFSFKLPASDPASTLESNEDGMSSEVGQNEFKSEQLLLSDGPGILEPVEWKFEILKIKDDVFTVVASGEIDEGWHVYASELESDEGPLPTILVLDDNTGFELLGKVQDIGDVITKYDESFMMELSYFEKEVQFTQDFKLTGEDVDVKGYIDFMVCDNEKCLPPEQISFDINTKDAVQSSRLVSADSADTSEGSYWRIFILGLLGGFVALLTPCVFPMIPLTVSFFTKQSKTKAKGISNALIYSSSIIIIYVLLGYGVTAIFGADALNILSTNVWFNLFFFVMLVTFAISFFGAFEITLPASWVNKADSASDRGGILGIFFMAFTLSLVSFSCTGPIIGTLLVDAAVNGGVMGPLIGMFGFSLALAMPFGLFAAFPGWLNSLPSSGGWLNSVKVVLGFLELAFAFKFLSNADLVVQGGYLKREVFIAIWIAIFALMTAYLLGFFSLPHDTKSERISVTRLIGAVFTLMFTIYLIPGIWGAPLNLISGFPPPMFYSESPHGVGASASLALPVSGEDDSGGEHCPHDLNCFHDYDIGMAYAKKMGKPVLLDFTGWACVNCRKMEEQVWSDPSVLKILRNDLVLISLYVDEAIDLPEEEQIEVQIGTKTKKLRTVGNKWSYLQAKNYNTNAQPFYVIIDHEENTMNGSAAYDPDIAKFKNWLQEGVDRFKSNPNLANR